MRLTLKIENFDYLPDGGPLEFSASDRGFEVGRDSAMDWTLPDPNRHISSRHFEVTFRDRQFLLHDISTNGTFVYGQSMRVSSPLVLSDNDRLQVGHYIIRAMIQGDAVQQAAQPVMPPQPQAADFAAIGAAVRPPAPAGDPWSMMPEAAPSTPQMPAPSHAAVPLAGQFGDSFIETPRYQAPPAPQAAPPQMPSFPQGQPAPMMPSSVPPVQIPPAQIPVAQPHAQMPSAPVAPPQFPAAPFQAAQTPPAPMMGGAAISEPFAPPPNPVSGPQTSVPPQSRPAASGQGAGAPAGADAAILLEAICRGAGLPPGSLSRSDPAQLGEDIGRCLRIATEELMALLGARAAAKQFVKSASRTMIGGMNNSPLKFKPNAAEALMTMFVQRPDSYLSSTAAFQQGFGDIKRHQTAVYAAMQPALARLLEDLAPEAIEDRAGGGLLSSKKAKAWEVYVQRWDAKTHPYENGMLDVFLAYFADAYDDAVKKTGG